MGKRRRKREAAKEEHARLGMEGDTSFTGDYCDECGCMLDQAVTPLWSESGNSFCSNDCLTKAQVKT